MKLVDNFKILVLFLGLVHISPGFNQTPFVGNLPCFFAVIFGFLYLDNELEKIREEKDKECEEKLKDQKEDMQEDFCEYLLDGDADIATCQKCLMATTAAECAAAFAGSAITCAIKDGLCGPVAGDLDV